MTLALLVPLGSMTSPTGLLWLFSALALLVFLPEVRRWLSTSPRATTAVAVLFLVGLVLMPHVGAFNVSVNCSDPNLSWWTWWIRGCALMP